MRPPLDQAPITSSLVKSPTGELQVIRAIRNIEGYVMIRHLVFLKYQNAVSQDTKEGILRDLEALKAEVSGFVSFGSGPNISPENDVVRGFLDMFWIDFEDTASRDAYLSNETHQGIAGRINAATDGGVDGVFVCDVAV
jgi:hypothetical protein